MPSPELQNLAEFRLYAADDEVAYTSERADVEKAVIGVWRTEHVTGAEALTEVEAETIAAAEAKQRLGVAVATARRGGASWEQIGRAAGVSSQSAQERWRGVDGISR